ncbi:dimeric dUTPase (all-alpha-NTP-PPase superfamily) [Virgibacillus natechei]|uniref:Dimeric dUTPase (All-alpha-NTP-PPase superfamily) n=1 Tax=Virgibacillus natechei TaxID=1216297 RepID=A0ABS4IL46_9BACI|nr:dUTP diphosphatase [Virgibacillus natechei]MBP1971603.1 dimeric dUTPase (all-alpha-NTP-PPase superfamily) [Virgibacillus natechei]UZD13066.1 dUTP diphosphatase [Virgibacillus natechei]
MNNEQYKRLSKIQSGLDNYIGESKGIDMKDYKLERIIALQVEFNELLQELPFLFKYWSNKEMNKEKALEEFVDGIHFLLSIGNDLNITDYEYDRPEAHDMKKIVFGIQNAISILPEMNVPKPMYNVLMHHYLLFGEKLGFTTDQIIDAYMSKNEVNYARQESGVY